jgi:release factor glutamine methyltransferase
MRIPSNKIKDIARFFREELGSLYDVPELETIIRYCVEEFTAYKGTDINSERTISESELLKFNAAAKELKLQKPLQYVLGRADFYGLKFNVNGNVLIPRPETEELVHLIIKDIKAGGEKNLSILDIGTGSGCIAISLKKHLPFADVSAVDVSEKVLELARLNAEQNNTVINFLQQDILSETTSVYPSSIDIIVSNPPYVRISEKDEMEKNVLDHEPHLALFVENDDALLFYRKIADHALKMLRPGGRLYFEINAFLGPETRDLIVEKGFKNVELIKDINGKNRILRGML